MSIMTDAQGPAVQLQNPEIPKLHTMKAQEGRDFYMESQHELGLVMNENFDLKADLVKAKADIRSLNERVGALEASSRTPSDVDQSATAVVAQPGGAGNTPRTPRTTGTPRPEATNTKPEKKSYRNRIIAGALIGALAVAGVVGAATGAFKGGGDKGSDGQPPAGKKNNPNNPNPNAPIYTNADGKIVVRANKLGGTVDRATVLLKGNADTKQINALYDYSGPLDALYASHAGNKQSEMISFDPETMGLVDAKQATAFNTITMPGYLSGFVNEAQGKEATAQRSDSREQQLAIARSIMTNQETQFSIQNMPDGLYDNHFQKDDFKVYKVTETLHNVRVLQIVTKDGQKILIKIGGGANSNTAPCLNFIREVVEQKTSTNTLTTTTTTTSTPATRLVAGPVTGHGNPGDHNRPTKPSKPEKPGEEKKCLPGYEFDTDVDRCLHPAASGPPPEADQAPRHQDGTPGYVPGNAEKVDATQHGDPANLNPTSHGTEVADSAAGGKAPGGGDQSVVSKPDTTAPANPDYQPGTESQGTTQGTSNNANGTESQTQGTGQTSDPATDPGMPN